MLRSTILSLVAIGTLAGCAGPQKRALHEALDDYHRGVRWARNDWCMEFIPLSKREQFAMRRASMKDLRIINFALTAVRMSPPDGAVVFVQLDWYQSHQGRMNTTVVREAWKRSGRSWLLTEQRWAGGAPLAWLDRAKATPRASVAVPPG